MSSPKRTAFSVLNTQRQLAKSLEAERLGTSHSDLTQRLARGSRNAAGPVEASLQNKLLAEIPSLTSKRKESAASICPSNEATTQLLARLRSKAKLALAKGDLQDAPAAAQNYNVLTEELLRISAVRHENEKQITDKNPKVCAKRPSLESIAQVEQVELTRGEDNLLDPLSVRTIRIDRDKIRKSKAGGGIIKRANIAPLDLVSYRNASKDNSKPSSLKGDTMNVSLLLSQLKKSPTSFKKSNDLEGQDSLFKKLLD